MKPIGWVLPCPVCRPLPFVGEPAPKLGDVAGELLARNEAGVPQEP